MLCHAMLRSVMPCHAMLCCAVLCCPVVTLCHAVLCSAEPCCGMCLCAVFAVMLYAVTQDAARQSIYIDLLMLVTRECEQQLASKIAV